jgi:hypothetical protein
VQALQVKRDAPVPRLACRLQENAARSVRPPSACTQSCSAHALPRCRLADSSVPLVLQDVGLVVLDEVHYLGDPSRGSVWEEVRPALAPRAPPPPPSPATPLLCFSASRFV